VARAEPFYVALTGNNQSDLVLVESADDFSDNWPVDTGRLDAAQYRDGEVVAGWGLARRLHLGAGSRFLLDTPGGPVSLTVEAVRENGDFGGENLIITPARFTALFGSQLPSAMQLVAAPGVDLNRLRNEAAAAGLTPGEQFGTVLSESPIVALVACVFGLVFGVVGMGSLVMVTPLLIGYTDS
jgi:hypothetical protein